MPFYQGRKIEAWQCGSFPTPDWVSALVTDNPEDGSDRDSIEIRAKRGIETVKAGDWIIKDPDGTIRTMIEAKFAMRYELADEPCTIFQAQIGDPNFMPTDAQLQELAQLFESRGVPIPTRMQQPQQAVTPQGEPVRTFAPEQNPVQHVVSDPGTGPAPVPQPDRRAVFGTPEAIRQRIDQRAEQARPAVHKHKAGDY